MRKKSTHFSLSLATIKRLLPTFNKLNCINVKSNISSYKNIYMLSISANRLVAT